MGNGVEDGGGGDLRVVNGVGVGVGGWVMGLGLGCGLGIGEGGEEMGCSPT